MRGDAKIEGEYRYWLTRSWDESAEPMTWIMLNPSTADAALDDPTIRRCIGFAKAWGFGSIWVVNLFALRSTDPANLRTHPDPIGPMNDHHIQERTRHSSLNVAAWGNHGAYLTRGYKVAATMPNLHVLSMTGEGQPGHPLYLPKTREPIPWVVDLADRGRATLERVAEEETE